MAINKNFVIKNGVQVSTDLIIGDADNNKVGIGTTIPGYDLHVGRGRKSRGGIGATDLVVTGVATINQLSVTGISTFAGALDVNSTVDFGDDVVFNGTNDITFDQSESALVLNDGAAIRVGTSSDFSISHDGSNTILRENGTGDLKVLSSRIVLGGTRNAGAGDTTAVFAQGAAAELWFDNSRKVETTSGGFKVTGIATLTDRLHVEAGISTFDADVRFGIGATVGFGTSAFFKDDAAIFLGDDSDLKIHHDGSNSRIQDVGTGDLILQGSADIKLQSASAENYIVANDTGSVDIFFDNSKKVETTSGGLKVTGITTLTDRLHVEAGISTFDADVRFGIGATVGFGTSAFFLDDAAIFMGNDSDLKIHHDGSNSRIQDVGTGDLILQGSADIKLQSASAENYIVANDTGSVEIYFDNSKKVETTSGGLNVTGITTFSDRINVVSGVSTFQDNAKLTFGTQGDLSIFHNGSHSFISDTTGTGDLFIQTNALRVENAAGDENMIKATQDGAVELFFNGAKMFQTTGIGITVGLSTIQHNGNAAFAGITTIGGNLNVTGNSFFVGMVTFAGGTDGNITLGDGAGDNVVFNADVNSNIIPNTDNAFDLGSSSQQWRNLHLTGTANIDTLDVDATSNFADDVTFAGDSANITFDKSTDDFIFDDGAKAIFGSSSDGLEIFHNSNNSFLKDSGTGGLFVQTNALTIENAAGDENMITATENGAVEVYYDSSKKLETTSGGLNVTGITTISDRLQVTSGLSTFYADVSLAASIGAGSSTVLFDSSAGTLTFQDNIRAKFGTGSDLDIHHNGTDSVITNTTNDLNIITTGDDINITAADDINLLVQGGENGVAIKGDGEVILYHNNNARVTTTSDGADFGGTGSIRVPNGTTGERNSFPAAGDFRYNTTTGKFEGYTDEWGDIGGSGGVEETSTSVSTTSATSTGSFAKASFRSAAVIAQITQGSAYQVGRYLLIHDGTTVTTIEESAVATGDMLGTFEGVINGSNVEFRVTMGSSSSATVKTKIDTVTV